MKEKVKTVLVFTFSPILTGLFLSCIFLCFFLVDIGSGVVIISNRAFIDLYFEALQVIVGMSAVSLLIGIIPATLVGVFYINTLEISVIKQNFRCAISGFLFTSPLTLFILLVLNSDVKNNYAMSSESIEFLHIVAALIPSFLGALTAFCISYSLNRNTLRRRMLMELSAK